MSDHDQAAWPPQAPEPVDGAARAEPAGPTVIEHVPDPAPVRVVQKRGGTPLGLTLLLTAALGGGLYYVWANPKGVGPGSDPGPAIAQARSQIESRVQPLADQMQSIAGRVDALEKRPAQPSPTPNAPAPDGSTADLAKQVSDLSTKVDALAAKQDGQAAELAKASELAAQKPAEPGAPAPDMTAAQAPALAAQQQVADLGHRVDDAIAKQTQAEQALAQQRTAADALQQRLEKLEAAAQSGAQAAQQGAADDQKKSAEQVAALNARVAKLEQGAGAVQGAAQNASRAVRVEEAEAALAAGQPLGDLPGAGPALVRYEKQAPPTDADLRARFPAIADSARAASQPDTAHRSFVDRMLARVQQSVTVRRGDHVIVGDPASGVLARAQDAVDRDDLKAAADAVNALTGPAADTVRPWVAQVRGLLEARAALAAMARG